MTDRQIADTATLEALFGQRQFAAVIEQGGAFIAQNPGSVAGHNVIGKANAMLGRLEQAADSFRAALAIDPGFAIGHNNLANILKMQGQTDDAAASYRRALEISPGDFMASKNLALLLHEAGRMDQAAAAWREVLRIRPDFALARAHMIHLLAHMCDWDALAAEEASIPALGVTGEFVPPFTMLPREDDPAHHRIRAERCAQSQFGPIIAEALPDVPRPATPADRIRIGYFSADFHDHATMYLMVRLFELYDRERFSVHVYSYGPDLDDGMQRRVKAAVDSFHDVRTMSDRDVAALARSEGIDIAVDLKGYTTDARLGILAWRPAPIQMTYLGYPGTVGAPFIDYLVADRIVIPPEQRRHYSESVITLPDSYQANDDSRLILEPMPTRAEEGLPENGLVFCCFNNSYKLTPDEFDIWMRLLGKVEGSVLWLLRANAWIEANLRKQAERRGISPDRLVFASPVPWERHMARHALGDLFLDSFRYNAHTTGSDALWAGVPVVTLIGRSFSARVAASLLSAIGMPELIATSPQAYEALALELASDRARLDQVRDKLRENRLTAPLFDSTRFTRHLETAYERAYRGWVEGRAPEDMDIAAE